jgi:hypothetical protein
MKWRKSSWSENGQLTCVEVARTPSRKIAARDSTQPAGEILTFELREWRKLLTEIKGGDHHLNG